MNHDTVCSPSRALMMTGCYAIRNGVARNDQVMNDIPTLADYLNESGYVTGYAGKWHLSGEARPGWAPDSYGWSDNRYMFNRGHYKMITEDSSGYPEEHPYQEIGDDDSYTTDWLTQKTIGFIREHQDERFAFMVSYPDPHQPWQVREPFNSMYAPNDMSIPATFSQALDPLTAWHEDMLGQTGKLTAERLKRIKSMYSGSVRLIDFNMGLIISELEQLDLLDKTLVVMTTDHGEYMGEHGLLYKNNFFERAYHLPLIIRDPRMEGGQTNDRFIGMVDFMPGILNLLGIRDVEGVDGRDFSMTLDSDEPWQDQVFIHHSQHDGAGLYTPDYFLLLHRSGEHLLFDRIRDPQGLYNVFGDPDYKQIGDSLSALVIEHHHELNTGEFREFLRPKTEDLRPKLD